MPIALEKVVHDELIIVAYTEDMAWLTGQIHSSWLIAWASASFVGGVMLVMVMRMPLSFSLLGLALVSIAFVSRRRWGVSCVVVGAMLVGMTYGSLTWEDTARLSQLHDKVVVVSGRIKEDPVTESKGTTTMQIDRLTFDKETSTGTIWLSTTSRREMLRGDIVTVQGELQQGFGTFAGVMYRAQVNEVVRPVPGDVGRVVRDWFATAVRLGIPEPQASLGIGFLTGQKSALPEDLSESLRIAGLTHIVGASGYNLTILVRVARRLFVKHSKYLATLTAAMMIIGFVGVTGLSPSMTRAGLVAGLSLLAWYYGRSFHPFVLLPFAAMLTVIAEPSFAWGDMGWQLSFAAFAGVMIVAPLMQRYFFGKDPPKTLRQIMGETVAVHLVTIPIVTVAFGTLSNVAIIANLMIVPFVPLAMLLTFLVGLVGLIAPVFVELAAIPVTWLLSYMTSVATYLAELPWAQLEVQPPQWAVALYVVALVAACWHAQRVTQFRLREVNLLD